MKTRILNQREVENYCYELGVMFDYSVNYLKYTPQYALDLLVNSNFCYRIEAHDGKYLDGMSGIEWIWSAIEFKTGEPIDQRIVDDRFSYGSSPSIDYWVGSMLALYQNYSGLTFKEILEIISVDELYLMYNKYHQVSEQHFLDKLDELANKTEVKQCP